MDFWRHMVLRILLEGRGGITVITIVISIENTSARPGSDVDT